MEYLLHVMCVVHPFIQCNQTGHTICSRPSQPGAQADQFQYPTAFVYHNRLQSNNLEGRRIFPQKEYARQSEHFYDYVT